MKNLIKCAFLIVFIIFSFIASSFSQNTEIDLASISKKKLDTRINILFGLNQPLLARGFNIEGNLFYKRFVFDYSHGVSLDFSGNNLSGDAADQKLALHLPFTTGFGVGYRFNELFNLRVEPKWHGIEVYQETDEQTEENLLGEYTTFTLGLGAYMNWQPFKNKNNFLKGFMISPSIRYWPRISSTLKDDKFEYFNTTSDQNEVHEAIEIGFGNSPLILNISVGYSFKLND